MAKNKALGDYIRGMKVKYEIAPGQTLARTEMSARIGKSPAVVGKIIRGESGAKPETLRKLADEFGADEDYQEMMRLAGHIKPGLPKPQLAPGTDSIDDWLNQMEPVLKPILEPTAAVVGVSVEGLKAIIAGRLDQVELAVSGQENPRLKELWSASHLLPDEAFRRVIEFALFERHRSESQE